MQNDRGGCSRISRTTSNDGGTTQKNENTVSLLRAAPSNVVWQRLDQLITGQMECAKAT